jgi:hypothetical protein
MKIKEFFESQSEEVAKCKDNTGSGYMSGLVNESKSRLYRDFNFRKTQVGPEHPEVLFDLKKKVIHFKPLAITLLIHNFLS